MAKFQYKMQNILDLYVKLESEAKIALTQANARLRNEEEKLEKIKREISDYENQIRIKSEGILDIVQLQFFNANIKYKKDEFKNQEKIIQKAEKEVEISRKKLQEVMVKRKTQEVLRERSYEEFIYELSKQEKKEIDELVSYQYNNRED